MITVAVSSEQYIDMLRGHFIRAIQERGQLTKTQLFFNSEAPWSLFQLLTLKYIKQCFLGDIQVNFEKDKQIHGLRIPQISVSSPRPLERPFYENNPPTDKRLRENIKREIRRIPVVMWERCY